MGKREDQRDRALGYLVNHVLMTGLSQTSLRQLAEAAGISDRMLLYYFDDKNDVMTAVLERLAAQLTVGLAAAIADDKPMPPAVLLRTASALTRQGEVKAFMQLWVEIVAAAARGETPYADIAARIAKGFILWVEARLDIADPERRRSAAAVIIAIIDGMAMLDAIDGGEMADLAAPSLENLFPA